MRPVLTVACLALLTVSLGCSLFKSNTTTVDPPPGPKWGVATPRADDLVAYLNRNGQSLRSIEAKSVFITAKQDNEHIGGLEGFLACQKAARPGTPPNFRLQALAIGSPEVDIGSNSEEFWFWIKRAPQPYVFHCAYADYPAVAKRGAMPFPFQPEWVVEALGMAEYDAKAGYTVNADSKTTFDLVQHTKSPKGTDIVKVIAFHKAPRPNGSQVAAYILYEPDTKGKLQPVCSAVIDDAQLVQLGGGKAAVLPRKVRLSCPREKMELTMELEKLQANVVFDQDRVSTLFTRRTLQNYKSYNLARGPDEPASGIRPTGGSDR
jgi:hypothetical protein